MNNETSYKRLWTAVILQAFNDLKSTRFDDRSHAVNAYNWFLSNDILSPNSFLNLCFALNYNHIEIRKKVEEIYKEKYRRAKK